MDAQVEQIGPCKKQLSIVVPPEEIKAKIEESYVQLRTSVDSSLGTKSPMVTGFRKGHIPQRLLEKRFGEQVLEDVREVLIMESYQKALEDHSLSPVGEPDFGDLPEKIEPDKPLELKVTVEVKPEFDVDGYKGIEVSKPSTDVAETDIDQHLEQMREAHADLQELKDAGAQERDILTCAVALTAEGKEIWTRPQAYAMAHGQGIAGLPVEGFADLMKDVKPGEQRETTVTLPDSFELEDWRGKQAQLTIKVEQIQRPVLPDLNDDWAKKTGFDSLQAVRDAVQRQIGRDNEQRARREMERQIEDRLLELVDFELPQGLLDQYTESLLQRWRVQLIRMGTLEDKLDEEVEKVRSASAEDAMREAKLHFILDKIGEKEKIFATEDDVARGLQSMAMMQRRKPIEVLERLRSQGGMSELRTSIREDKIRSLLMDEARKTDAAAAEPSAETTPVEPPESKQES